MLNRKPIQILLWSIFASVTLSASTVAGLAGEPPLPTIEPKVTTPPFTSPSGKAVTPQDKFEIGFWNIRWFPGHHPVRQDEESREKQRKAVQELITTWNPEILFVSEIRDLAALESLEVDHPFRAVTDIVRTEDENPDLPQQGLGVLSRLPWEDIWTLDFSGLPLTEDKPSRGILGVQFKTPSGRLLTCYAVHLKSNRGGIEATQIRRQRAIDYLRWDWGRKNLEPDEDWIVVLGDFNTSMEDPAFQTDQTLNYLMSFGFVHAGEGLPRDERVTIHGGRYPANDFDHIFLSKAIRQALGREDYPRAEVRKVPGEVSDHDAIFIDMSRIFTGKKNR